MSATHRVDICPDCYYYSAMGWDEHDMGRPLPDPAPMSLLEADYDITAVDDDPEAFFSSRPCDGCGDHLAGDRYECWATDRRTVWGMW